MTAASEAETLEGTWKPIPGYAGYEASHRGYVRSVDRVVKGRRYRGTVLATRVSNKGYELVNVRDDDGNVRTVTVHKMVMLAHVGPCPPGQEIRHWHDDPLDNRWPESLLYGTPEDNVLDALRNRAPRRRWSRRVADCVASRLRRWRV